MNKKQILIYSSGLILSTFLGILMGRITKKRIHSSGTLNIIHVKNTNDYSIMLHLTENKVSDLCKKKVVLFHANTIEIEGEDSAEPPNA